MPEPAWRRPTNRWYPGSRLLAWLTEPWYAWIVALLLLAAIIVTVLASPTGVYVVKLRLLIVTVAAGLALWGRQCGWRLEADGLRQVRIGWPGRLFPFSEMKRVVERDGLLRIDVADETLSLPLAARGSHGLGRRLQAILGDESATTGVIPPEVIATQLGLAYGGTLELGVSGWQRAAMSLVPALFSLPILLDRRESLALRLCLGACFVGLSILSWLQFRPLRVTPQGLRRGRWVVSWDDVNRLVGHRVYTEHGIVDLVGPDAERVGTAIRWMLDARQAGAVLPRMVDVPDTALSRTASQDFSERGISQSE